MFCEKCGSEIKKEDKFCVECGHPAISSIKNNQPPLTPNDKWWHRLLKVLYVIAYLPLLGIIPFVWSINKPYSYYSYYSKTTTSYGSYSDAFWYSLLTLAIYLVVLRLIKVAVLYVALGQSPDWKNQFKKFF